MCSFPGPEYHREYRHHFRSRGTSACRRLQEPATEFVAQGLELDHVLLVWGGDFILSDGKWDHSMAKINRDKSFKYPLQLRQDAYRVLLTRGREGAIICLPSGIPILDETFSFLVDVGCDVLV